MTWNNSKQECPRIKQASQPTYLALQVGNDLADRLGGTRRGRNEIVQGTTTGTPVLAALGGSVHDELIGRTGVNGRHEAFDNAEFVVQDLGDGGQAVGRAGRVGKDSLARVGLVVDPHDKHGLWRKGEEKRSNV